MRALALVLAVVVALFVVTLMVLAVAAVGQRREARQRRHARWGLRHHGDRGETVVAVSLMLPDGRVLDEHIIARISDASPDWTERFLLAKQRAEEQAFHLNAGGNPLPPA